MIGEKDGRVSWLEAETIFDVKELELLERLLVAAGTSPVIEVADYSLNPRQQLWKIRRLTYEQKGIETLYEVVKRYR